MLALDVPEVVQPLLTDVEQTAGYLVPGGEETDPRDACRRYRIQAYSATSEEPETRDSHAALQHATTIQLQPVITWHDVPPLGPAHSTVEAD
jgi:hypothetical protein